MQAADQLTLCESVLAEKKGSNVTDNEELQTETREKMHSISATEDGGVGFRREKERENLGDFIDARHHTSTPTLLAKITLIEQDEEWGRRKHKERRIKAAIGPAQHRYR